MGGLGSSDYLFEKISMEFATVKVCKPDYPYVLPRQFRVIVSLLIIPVGAPSPEERSCTVCRAL